jgi:proteasome lid subunit RPN8/RPN11
LAYEVPDPDDLPVFLDRMAADAIERHALSDTSVELGGILLGKECLDQQTGQPFVWVTHSLEAKHYANTQASFTYTHDSWEEITRQRDQRFPDHDIVGWYHTHPSFGIFLSHHDLFIHQNFFAHSLQVAYVVDPINQTRGFFQWREGAMAQVAGYFLTADRGDRQALARIVNDLERIPNSEAGSGGNLSPRLEAELINMLTRPTARHDTTSTTQTAQLAGTYGLLGIFLGMLIVAAAFWVFQTQSSNHEHTQSLKVLSDQVEKLSKGLVNDADHTSAERRLVTGVLDKVVSGQKSVAFEGLFENLSKQLDSTESKYNDQLKVNEVLAKHLEREAAEHQLQLAITRKELDEFKIEAKKVVDLEIQIAGLQKQAKDAMDSASDSVVGEKKSTIEKDLVRMRYVAYAGWICSALLSLGLAASYFYWKPLADDGTVVGDTPQAHDGPTHRIE